MKLKLRPKGPLAVISTILIASAVLRIAGVSMEAFALEQVPAGQNTPEEIEQKSSPSGEELDGLLKGFALREERLKIEEQRISQRTAELEEFEKVIAAKISEMELAETQLRDVLAMANTAAEDDISRLTSVYETMKPKDAASVFEQMEPEFAVGLLSRMKVGAAASIMAGLSPETAYAISVVLAGRRAGSAGEKVAR